MVYRILKLVKKNSAQKKLRKSSSGISRIVILIVVAVVAIIAISFASGAFKGSLTIGKNAAALYTNPDDQISIKTPSNWKLQENPNSQTTVAFFAPQEKKEDKFIENVGVSIADLSARPNTTLDEIAKAWIDDGKQSFPDSFEVVSQENTTVGGVEARKITVSTKDNISNLKSVVFITIRDKKTYIFNYSAEEQSFETFLPAVDKLITSVKFGPTKIVWETFKNDKYGYAIKYPKGWIVKDNSGETKRGLTVVHPKNFANILIAAHKDDSLKEEGGMVKAIKARKEFLEEDSRLQINGFKDSTEDKKGGWLMIGEKTIDGRRWQLEERGLLDIYGKVLLMQSGYSEDYGVQYKDTVREVMSSFSVE